LLRSRCCGRTGHLLSPGRVVTGRVSQTDWEPDASYLRVIAVPGGVSGWVWRYPSCFGAGEVGVAFVAEEDAPPADVFVGFDGA
jgi:hypothetical protein